MRLSAFFRSETNYAIAEKFTKHFSVEIANAKVLSTSLLMTERVMPLVAHGESCVPT
jgi:hypothetical protein